MRETIETGRPFLAKAALAEGLVTRHGLSTRYTAVFPGVYASTHATLSPRDRIRAVWLWAPAGAVLAGWAAAVLHGERWYSAEGCGSGIDLFTDSQPRIPDGVRERRLRCALPAVDLVSVGGMTVTSPARTAVDLARWTRGHDRVVCVVDSLCNATRTSLDAVAAAAVRMPGQHGVSRAVRLIRSCDPRSESPQESLLRLSIARSCLPPPTSQLRISNDYAQHVATADLGYERERVAIFYDGSIHGGSEQWRWDIRVNAELADLGWQVVRVTAGMSPAEVLRHIDRALDRARLHGST